MKISYAITVCNEYVECIRLINFLHQHKRLEDEICILLDKPKATEKLVDELYYWASRNVIKLRESEFKGDFSEWKNELASMCSGDYIFQIDADEYPAEELVNNLPEVLKLNPEIDLFVVPRINTVEGLTESHIQQWGWSVNERNFVNFPDYQTRIYKNNNSIKWKNKVHERIHGYKLITMLPPEDEWCLHHPKTIERQERQNNFYITL